MHSLKFHNDQEISSRLGVRPKDSEKVILKQGGSHLTAHFLAGFIRSCLEIFLVALIEVLEPKLRSRKAGDRRCAAVGAALRGTEQETVALPIRAGHPRGEQVARPGGSSRPPGVPDPPSRRQREGEGRAPPPGPSVNALENDQDGGITLALENGPVLSVSPQLTTLGNLTPSSTVFFCCDMQERFRPAIKYFGDIISVGQRLLQGARILGIPVIVTEQYPKGLGSTVQEIDLTGVKLVLPKTKFSMVLPEVEAALAEIPGVRSVVLFGVETHVCIQQTALELVGRGVEVHIVADATSSRSMMDRMFALERLARTGIIVTTSEAVLLQLVADKDHPKFKEIQNLIKASAPESGLLSKV
ncbi:PREDICTED: isochorismatase domain-containing protein 1 [Dipodomys ordii]|nr:PREDICTED: isochorismatase domain-containing protein 1 [Dipodomys ordii]